MVYLINMKVDMTWKGQFFLFRKIVFATKTSHLSILLWTFVFGWDAQSKIVGIGSVITSFLSRDLLFPFVQSINVQVYLFLQKFFFSPTKNVRWLWFMHCIARTCFICLCSAFQSQPCGIYLLYSPSSFKIKKSSPLNLSLTTGIFPFVKSLLVVSYYNGLEIIGNYSNFFNYISYRVMETIFYYEYVSKILIVASIERISDTQSMCGWVISEKQMKCHTGKCHRWPK